MGAPEDKSITALAAMRLALRCIDEILLPEALEPAEVLVVGAMIQSRAQFELERQHESQREIG